MALPNVKSGNKKLWIFCAAVFAMGFIAAAYLNFVQYQNYQDNTSLLNGTITDLKYQLAQDTASASGSPTPTPSASASATPSATPTPTAPATATPTATPAAATAVTNQLANLHAGPDVNTAVKVQLAKGTTVTLNGAVSNNYQPVTVSGNSGYVRQDYLTY